jgi:hypothetical protein
MAAYADALAARDAARSAFGRLAPVLSVGVVADRDGGFGLMVYLDRMPRPVTDAPHWVGGIPVSWQIGPADFYAQPAGEAQ